MDRDSSVREIARLTGEMAKQARRSDHTWSAKGEEASLVMLLMKGNVLPSEIAAAAGVSTARVANMLKQMEGKGLVIREADSEDRRCVRVKLTDAGREKAQNLVNCVRNTWEKLIDYLGEEDTDSLLRIMARILDFMQSDDTCADASGFSAGGVCAERPANL